MTHIGRISLLCLLGSIALNVQAQDRTRMEDGKDPVVQKIDELIRQGWQDNEVTASDPATDEEWLRRAYLDVVGHIPPADAIQGFLKDKEENKRAALIDKLLDDDAYVRNWSTIWTNNSIGRGTPRRVSRAGMSRFFREVFARNRPWDEVVVDIVTAKGHFEKNGEVNYILAQLQNNDKQVQLTAKTARLFMGVQVQCTQCHNHPFNDWKQDQFWQLNAFFQRVGKRDVRKVDPDTGRRVDDYSEVIVRRDFRESSAGLVRFDKRNAQVRTVAPAYFGKEVKFGDYPEDTDLRRELASFLMKGGEEGEVPLIAKSMVNRVWAHMFGYGFTRPLDDMGPHNAASHPELFDFLAAEFVKNKYNVKDLIRWVANTEAYALTSKFGAKNEIDNPSAGETPLFSHMYVKAMEAEQLYNSLIVATNAHKSGKTDYEESQRRRNRWMQQFVVAFGTDENDESTTFNGTIPQALMMMNGELVNDAVNCKPGSYLHTLLTSKGKDIDKVQSMYLAALTRKATRNELRVAGQLLRKYPQKAAGYQDLFWALLNSNEFVFVH